MDIHDQFEEYALELRELTERFDREGKYTEWELFYKFMEKLINRSNNGRIRASLLLLFFDDREPLYTNLQNMIIEIETYSDIELNKLVYSEHDKNIVVDFKNEGSKWVN